MTSPATWTAQYGRNIQNPPSGVVPREHFAKTERAEHSNGGAYQQDDEGLHQYDTRDYDRVGSVS